MTILAGLVSWIAPTWREVIAIAIAAAVVVQEFTPLRIRLPENRRQIPRTVFDRDVKRGALQFGFELGTGVRTYVTSTAPYALAAAVLLLEIQPLLAILIGISFGVGRALMPVSRYLSNDGDAWDDLLARRGRWLVRASSTVCACTTAVLAFGGLP